MRFRLPFDDVQLNAAVRHHGRLRTYAHRLRREYPPSSPEEREALSKLRSLIQDFARELQKPRAKIIPARLNEVSADITRVAVDYIAGRGFSTE